MRRTLWLLRRGETRLDTLRYLAAHTAGTAYAHGRGLARTRLTTNRPVR